MSVILRVLYYLLAIPAGVVLVVLAVANRHFVPVRLDPFDPTNEALIFNLPVFVLVFLALFAGLVIGGFAVWVSQGRWRRLARREAREISRLEEKVEGKAPTLSARRPAP